jgi:hypothetical protein
VGGQKPNGELSISSKRVAGLAEAIRFEAVASIIALMMIIAMMMIMLIIVKLRTVIYPSKIKIITSISLHGLFFLSTYGLKQPVTPLPLQTVFVSLPDAQN